MIRLTSRDSPAYSNGGPANSMSKRGGTDSLTIGQTLATALVVGAVSWFSITVVGLYRDSGVSQSEVHRLTERITALEARCRP